MVLTEGGKVEVAPGSVERAIDARVGVGEIEVAEEGVAPDRVVGEEAPEPVAGEGEAQQVEAAQVLGHLRPHVRLVPASRNTVFRVHNSGSKLQFRDKTGAIWLQISSRSRGFTG